MAQMTLDQLVTAVQDYIPGKPITQVGRAANMVISRIYNEVPFQARSTFTTTAPITSGTVGVTLGSASITASGTPFTSGNIYLIRILGNSTWFTGTATSTSAITLSSVWPEATNATATYEAVSPFISLPSTVLHPIELRIEGDRTLRRVPDEAAGEMFEQYSSGRPLFYSSYTITTADSPDDSYRLMLNPAPDDRYTITYTYAIRPTFFTATVGGGTSLSSLPAIWDSALLYGTLFHCWEQEDKQDRSAYWYTQFEIALAKARAERMANMATTIGDPDDGGLWNYETRPFV